MSNNGQQAAILGARCREAKTVHQIGRAYGPRNIGTQTIVQKILPGSTELVDQVKKPFKETGKTV